MNKTVIVEPGIPHRYRYRLSPMHASSAKSGDCEICKQWCSDVYFQSQSRAFDLGDGKERWAQMSNAFGHKECLIGIRKEPYDVQF